MSEKKLRPSLQFPVVKQSGTVFHIALCRVIIDSSALPVGIVEVLLFNFLSGVMSCWQIDANLHIFAKPMKSTQGKPSIDYNYDSLVSSSVFRHLQITARFLTCLTHNRTCRLCAFQINNVFTSLWGPLDKLRGILSLISFRLLSYVVATGQSRVDSHRISPLFNNSPSRKPVLFTCHRKWTL